MTNGERKKLENCELLQALLDSHAWALDSAGLLERAYYDICNSIEISADTAAEYLHEED